MKTNYTPPYTMILISICLINIIFSTYFITILFVGVVFKIFLEVLKKEYYYLLAFVVFTFLVIETTQGFKIFSLTIISMFLYYFIIPKVKHLFSSSIMIEFTFILFFYFCISLMINFLDKFNLDIFYVLLFNFILDSFIAGFLI